MPSDYSDTLNLLRDLARMVRQSDRWRGWVGWDDDAPSDREVARLLEFAMDCVSDHRMRADTER